MAMGSSTVETQRVPDLLRQGFSLPSSWYTDPAVFEIERRTVFRHNWLYFGHVDEVPTPGSYRAATVGTYPVVVTRNREGTLRAFLNICRHRLHRVVEDGSGRANLLLCHYHAWSYDLDGALRGMPRSAEVFEKDGENFDREQFGLIPVRIDTWGGLIFVNMDQAAPDLAEQLGVLRALAAERGVNFSTHPRRCDDRLVAVNWKTLVDNVIECYHCPTVHPDFSTAYDTANGVHITCDEARCSIAIPRKGDTLRFDGHTLEYHAYFLPPTCYLSARGSDWLFLFIVEPVDVGSCRLISHLCFPEGMPEDEVQTIFDAALRVNEEDVGVALSVQRGHSVGDLPPAYLMPGSERQLRAFAEFVYEAVNAAGAQDRAA